jgi:hypothetical protein
LESRYKLLIVGFLIAVIFVAVGVFLFGFANETLDVFAGLFGSPEWDTWTPPFPDYGIPGLEENPMASFLLGVGVTGFILALTFLIGWLITRRNKPSLESG